MISTGRSDMASSIKLAEQNLSTKASLEAASVELSSGRKTDLIDATAGDLGKLFAIDRTILRLETNFQAAQLAGGKASLAQAALGNIHDNLVEIGPQLLSAVERGDQQSSKLIAADARHALGAVVSSINSRYGRHSIFAGATVDHPAIGSAEDILNDVSAIIAGSPNSASAIMAIDDYFLAQAEDMKRTSFWDLLRMHRRFAMKMARKYSMEYGRTSRKYVVPCGRLP